jgi:hypothetical protein
MWQPARFLLPSVSLPPLLLDLAKDLINHNEDLEDMIAVLDGSFRSSGSAVTAAPGLGGVFHTT